MHDNCEHNFTAIAPSGPTPTPPPEHSWESLMHMALLEAEKAQNMGEVPVGAIIVSTKGKILAKAHNQCIKLHDPSAHAEILALRMAGQKLNNYRLNDAIMVVTLEPCLMCAGAIVNARLSGLVYGAIDKRAGAISTCCEGLNYAFLNHTTWHMGGIESHKCAQILKKFFIKRV